MFAMLHADLSLSDFGLGTPLELGRRPLTDGRHVYQNWISVNLENT